jgi:hypothetical protein
MPVALGEKQGGTEKQRQMGMTECLRFSGSVPLFLAVGPSWVTGIGASCNAGRLSENLGEMPLKGAQRSTREIKQHRADNSVDTPGPSPRGAPEA